MKRSLLLLMLLFSGVTGFCTTWIISNSGDTFTPATITITFGDDVQFNLDAIHNVVEVSQTTWNANGNTPLVGGFQVAFGGGLVPSSLLTTGTHYYVCGVHASLGMKGIIIVQNATGIRENNLFPDFSVFPNPAKDLITIKTKSNVAGSEFFITDPTGKRVYSGRLNDETTQIDISNLTQGFYLIRVTGKSSMSVKVLKN